MTRRDKIAFWIIEILVISISVIAYDSWYAHQYCGTYLYENPGLAEEIWLGKIIHLMTLVAFGLTVTVCNLVALYSARLKLFNGLTKLSRISFRIFVFVVAFVVIWGLLMLCRPALDALLC